VDLPAPRHAGQDYLVLKDEHGSSFKNGWVFADSEVTVYAHFRGDKYPVGPKVDPVPGSSAAGEAGSSGLSLDALVDPSTCTVNLTRVVEDMLMAKTTLERADAHFLAIEILNKVQKHVEVPEMQFAGKRARITSTEKSKPLKVAAARIEAEEFIKREVTDPAALNIMTRARTLFNEGPETPALLCGNLTAEEIASLQRFIDEEEERNGPAFYMKLLPLFMPEFRQFKVIFEQLFLAKSAMERSWNYRMHNLFMNTDCSMTRDGITLALDERRTAIKKQQEEHERGLQMNAVVQQQMDNVLQNPQALLQLINDPRVQAALVAARANPDANRANPDAMD
jgi:hypothetical protein